MSVKYSLPIQKQTIGNSNNIALYESQPALFINYKNNDSQFLSSKYKIHVEYNHDLITY